MEKWAITIEDVLSRDVFRNAKLVAGLIGVQREIKWTHILEAGDIESFINGGELILTTGSGIQFDSPEGIPYIEKLKNKNVAGICIELGTNIKKIHPDIIQYGNDHNFPLIVFNEIVKFVDITQDLHTLIINNHHHMLSQLNIFSKTVNELSLLPNGILKILKELYLHMNIDILFMTDDTKNYYYPPKAKDDCDFFQTLIEKTSSTKQYGKFLQDSHYYLIFPIKGLGHTWGYLCLKHKSSELDEFSFSLIDRANLAIAQIMLRNRTIEERKQNQEEDIIRRLIQGKNCDGTEIQKVLPAPAKNLNYRLFLIQNHNFETNTNREDWEEIKLQQSIIIRSLFRKGGCIPAISISKDKIVVIASFYKNDKAEKDTDRFQKISEEIKRIEEKNIFYGNQCTIGISNLKQDYNTLDSSYREAKNVILIQSFNLIQTYFYENIGVYRVLLEMLEHDSLHTFVQEYLGPILNYDKQTKGELLLTLSTYLQCLGSKKLTAERLYIVRQTLYHRLEKISNLLGEDFMNPVNRQAIELAVTAYHLLEYKELQKEGTSHRTLVFS
ncbi:PucR family transcriptional regulator [Oceanobacillus senegalensis]|uniref:PucR family transcriptional regulator n=1 Tax=Oceanobacillus senegalensis TaxID=1936063 RepID=UPI000A312A51|nr:PucR family transcriptional regulator [Oceanobacillus senegalensis]